MKIEYKSGDAEKFDFVFVGATALAVGAAAELTDAGKKCLVIDRLALPGHEFCCAMKDSGTDLSRLDGELAKKTVRELESRAAINPRGNVRYAALSPVLSEILGARDIAFYPFCEVKSIVDGESRIALELACHGCGVRVDAGCVVDTTNSFESGALLGLETKKSSRRINAAIEICGTEVREIPGATIRDTGFDGDMIVSVEIDDGGDGRNKIYELATGGLLGAGVKVITPADEPDEDIADDIGFVARRFMRAPSAKFAAPLEALDRGAKLANELAKVFAADFVGCDSPLPEMREPELDGEYDLLVCGLGTAGAICAISAARRGLRVVGVEKMSCPGGAGTAGGVFSYYLGARGGLYTEIDRRAKELQDLGFSRERGNGAVTKAYALQNALADAGVSVRMSSDFVSVLRDPENPRKIVGVRYLRGGRIFEVRAKITVDATADALVCLDAGCETVGGRRLDRACQIYSCVSRKFLRETSVSCGRYADDGRVDQYVPREFGRAMIKSLGLPMNLPERFDDASVRHICPAPLPGLREGAKIVGEENVTGEDILLGARADDPVMFDIANIDNHGRDTALEDRPFRDMIEIASLWDARITIPIPLGALIPRGYSSLIVAGRCLSVDHTVSFATRMKSTMQQCGEVAAILARAAIESGVEPAAVPYDKIRDELFAAGILTGAEVPYSGYRDESSDTLDAEDIFANPPTRAELESDRAGDAILLLSREKSRRDELCAFCREGGRLALNAALALSLCDGELPREAEDAIVRAISDKSGELSRSSYTFDLPYAVAAMSAAGRKAIVSAVSPLLSAACDPGYADGIPLRDPFDGPTRLCDVRGDLAFVYFSSAMASLYEIAKARPLERERIKSALSKLDLARMPHMLTFIGRANDDPEDMTESLKLLLGKILAL